MRPIPDKSTTYLEQEDEIAARGVAITEAYNQGVIDGLEKAAQFFDRQAKELGQVMSYPKSPK